MVTVSHVNYLIFPNTIYLRAYVYMYVWIKCYEQPRYTSTHRTIEMFAFTTDWMTPAVCVPE